MWWTGLPGMDAPPASGRSLADRAVALACAHRISPVNVKYGNGTARTEEIAGSFRYWLTEAQDASDAHARRLALCMACQEATPDTSKSVEAPAMILTGNRG